MIVDYDTFGPIPEAIKPHLAHLPEPIRDLFEREHQLGRIAFRLDTDLNAMAIRAREDADPAMLAFLDAMAATVEANADGAMPPAHVLKVEEMVCVVCKKKIWKSRANAIGAADNLTGEIKAFICERHEDTWTPPPNTHPIFFSSIKNSGGSN